MLSVFLHPTEAAQESGHSDSIVYADQETCCKGKPCMVTTFAGNAHKLPIGNAMITTPIWDAPGAGYHLTERRTARLVLSTPASTHACVPEAIIKAVPQLRQYNRSDSAGTSVSMLSIHAPSNASGSKGSSFYEGSTRCSSGLASGAVTPGGPMQTVRGGTLDVPTGVSVDIEDSLIFEKIHFRDAFNFQLRFGQCQCRFESAFELHAESHAAQMNQQHFCGVSLQ